MRARLQRARLFVRRAQHRLPEARKLIEKALEIAPEDYFIIDSLGWVLYREGDLKGAARELRRAYSGRPDAEIGAHSAKCCGCSASATRRGASGTSRSRPARERDSAEDDQAAAQVIRCTAGGAARRLRAVRIKPPAGPLEFSLAGRIAAHGKRIVHRQHRLAPRSRRRRDAHQHAHRPGRGADRAPRRRGAAEDRRAARIPRCRLRGADRARARLPPRSRAGRMVQGKPGARKPRLEGRIPGVRRAAPPTRLRLTYPGRGAPRDRSGTDRGTAWYPAPGSSTFSCMSSSARGTATTSCRRSFGLIDRATASASRRARRRRSCSTARSAKTTFACAPPAQAEAGGSRAATSRSEEHPVGGGLGGGSSDAATVLLVLNQLWKAAWAPDCSRSAQDSAPTCRSSSTAATRWAKASASGSPALDLPPAWYLV